MNDQTESRTDAADNPSGRFARDAGAMGSEARAQMDKMTSPLRDNLRNVAEQQKSAGADRLVELGNAVHGAASGMEKELPQAAQFIHSAADQLQSASAKLRDRSVDDLVAGFTRFARQQPAAAFAGAVLAGFALSRFLKSSSADQGAQR
jgi:hypothetical protein